MILYSLVCEQGHEFEAWFQDSAAYDKQAAAGTVTCPQCGTVKVTKAVMAPRIGRRSGGAEEEAPSSSPADAPLRHASARDAKLAQMLRALREHVERNYDYVGPRFAEEARRIHYGETESRDIYGETTPQEARALTEEGIPIAPLPPLPRRHS